MALNKLSEIQLSPEEMQKVAAPAAAPGFASNKPTVAPPAEKPATGIFGRVAEKAQKRFGDVSASFMRGVRGEQNPLSTGFQTVVGGVGGLAMDVMGEGIKSAIGTVNSAGQSARAALTPGKDKEDIKAEDKAALMQLGKFFAESKPGKDLAVTTEWASKHWGEFEKKNPEAAANLKATGTLAEILATVVGAKPAKEGLKAGFEAGVKAAVGPDGGGGAAGAIVKGAQQVNKGLETGADALITGVKSTPAKPLVQGLERAFGEVDEVAVRKATERAEKAIEKGVQKGIKPSVSGKGTAAATKLYNKRTQEAVDSITRNADNLEFTNDFTGEVTRGHVPENLSQFSQSIQQTKSKIWEKANTMVREAGEDGLTVDLNTAANELDKIASNKAMQDFGAADYAKASAERLRTRGAYTLEESEEALKILNESLKSYFKNPTRETASAAAVDSIVANQIRNSLDTAVTSVKGEGYQALRNEYAALKAIEKEVADRALVDARKNTKGLIDFSNLATASQIVGGIVSHNPAQIASGITGKAMAVYYKMLNDPNRAIRKMFEATSDLAKKKAVLQGKLQAPTPPVEPTF